MKTIHSLLVLTMIVAVQGPARATINFTDGTHVIDYVINDYVHISGADTQVTLAANGWVKSISVTYDGASFSMTGGTIQNNLIALSSSPVFIYGGHIGGRLSLDSYGSAKLDGDVTVYGSNFIIDNQAVDYGTYHFSGHLFGTLVNGDLLDVDVNCSGANDLILASIPEPATLSLLVLGVAMALRKRK